MKPSLPFVFVVLIVLAFLARIAMLVGLSPWKLPLLVLVIFGIFWVVSRVFQGRNLPNLVGIVQAVEFVLGILTVVFFGKVVDLLVAIWNAPSPDWGMVKLVVYLLIGGAVLLLILIKMSPAWKARSDAFFGLLFEAFLLVGGYGGWYFLYGVIFAFLWIFAAASL